MNTTELVLSLAVVATFSTLEPHTALGPSSQRSAPGSLLSSVSPLIARARTEVRLARPVLVQTHALYAQAVVDKPRYDRDSCTTPAVGVHVTSTAIWVGKSLIPRVEIDATARGHDWARMHAALAELDKHYDIAGSSIEFSTEPDVTAATMVTAFHELRDAGFAVAYTEAAWGNTGFLGESLDGMFPARTVGRHSVAVIAYHSKVLVATDDGVFEIIGQPEGRWSRESLRRVKRLLEQERHLATDRGQTSYIHICPDSEEPAWFAELEATVDELGYRVVDNKWIRIGLIHRDVERRGLGDN